MKRTVYTHNDCVCIFKVIVPYWSHATTKLSQSYIMSLPCLNWYQIGPYLKQKNQWIVS